MSSAIKYVAAADGANIAYESDGQGPPLLYVRGWISNLELQRRDEAIERFFRPLRDHRTVVRYDSRGNGLSDWDLPGPITEAALLADLEAVADTIDGSFDIWATTYGGPLAIDYIANNPDRIRKVILDGTYARGSSFVREDQAEAMFDLLAMAKVSPDLVFSSLSFMTDPDPLITHEARVERMRKSISPTAVEQLYRIAFEYDVEELLPLVTQPTLLLHRSGSKAVNVRSARQLAAAIPEAELRLLDGAAHNLYEGEWQTALRHIADFLDLPIDLTTELDAASRESEVLVVMFTDIAGSTQMTSDEGDERAQRVLRDHDRIVRDALASCAGTEIKHTGDGMLVSFRGVVAAVRAATRIVAAAAALPDEGGPRLEVKIGINAGEPLAESGDLYGSCVQIAARVCDLAAGNEVVVTDVVRALLRGKQDHPMESLGTPSLKGVDESIEVWRLHQTAGHT